MVVRHGARRDCASPPMGEWKGSDEVRAAMNDLGAERIGHGVRASEDMALVEEIAERGVARGLAPARMWRWASTRVSANIRLA